MGCIQVCQQKGAARSVLTVNFVQNRIHQFCLMQVFLQDVQGALLSKVVFILVDSWSPSSTHSEQSSLVPILVPRSCFLTSIFLQPQAPFPALGGSYTAYPQPSVSCLQAEEETRWSLQQRRKKGQVRSWCRRWKDAYDAYPLMMGVYVHDGVMNIIPFESKTSFGMIIELPCQFAEHFGLSGTPAAESSPAGHHGRRYS